RTHLGPGKGRADPREVSWPTGCRDGREQADDAALAVALRLDQLAAGSELAFWFAGAAYAGDRPGALRALQSADLSANGFSRAARRLHRYREANDGNAQRDAVWAAGRAGSAAGLGEAE